MPRYTGDSVAIDNGVSTLKTTASNMISILKKCVIDLDKNLSSWNGPASESVKEVKEQIMAMLDTDRETFERLGLYCEDAANLIDAAEEACSGFTI